MYWELIYLILGDSTSSFHLRTFSSLRQHGTRQKGDERILGSSEFVMTVLWEAEEKQRRQVKIGSAGASMLHLIDEECRRRRINPQEVRSGGRRTNASEARTAIAYRATTEFGLPAAEIARHLGDHRFDHQGGSKGR